MFDLDKKVGAHERLKIIAEGFDGSDPTATVAWLPTKAYWLWSMVCWLLRGRRFVRLSAWESGLKMEEICRVFWCFLC